MTAELPPPPRAIGKPLLTPEQYAEADARYLKGESSHTIAKDFGCKPGMLDTRFCRKGLPELRRERQKQGRGSRTKDKYAQISEEIADKLVGNAPKSLQALEKHAEVALKGGKLGAIVHGWDAGTQIAIVMAGDLGGRAESVEDEAIDIEEVAPERHQGEQ